MVVLVIRAFGDDAGSADATGGSGGRTNSSPSAGDDPPDTTGKPDATAAEPPGEDVPPGYRLVSDPLDFTVAVPQGWERRLDGPTRVDFVSPDGSQFLRVDQIPQAGPDAEQAWLDAEPAIADSLSGYSRIRIEPLDYRGWQSADWEFTWEGESGSVHVLNRGIITEPRGFALYMSGPDATWEAKSLPVFRVAAATFEPSS